MVNAVASACLSSQFADVLPDYPKFAFREPVTQANIGQMATAATEWLVGPVKTQPGTIVLEGLELLDGDRVAARESRYGKHFLSLLQKKGEGQVVNRSEIMEYAQGVEREARSKLEPEWVAVILLALVHQGELTLAIPGKKIDAGSLDEAARTPLKDLLNFRHIERPKGLPVSALKALLELLGLPSGLATSSDQAKLVTDLQAKVAEQLVRALTEGGMPCDVKELRARFDAFIENQTLGKDVSKVRVVIEEKSELG